MSFLPRPTRLPLVAVALLLACSSDEGGTTEPEGTPIRILIYPEAGFVYQGKARTLIDTVMSTEATVMKGADVVYTSLDSALVTTTPGGKIRSVGGTGVARLKASYRGLDTVFTVAVLERVGEVHVDHDSLVIPQGERQDLYVTFFSVSGKPYGIPGLVQFVSRNSRVATVENTGYVHGISKGLTTIQVIADSITVNIPVRVVSP